MPLFILGLNHNTAPVEIREQVVFEGDEVDRALGAVTGLAGVSEAVVLSTCNRTEFYLDADLSGREAIRSWLESDQSLSGDAASPESRSGAI